MSFSNNNKLAFIDSFQFLCSSLDSSSKNLDKDDLKYSSQKVEQKGLYPYEYMSGFKKIKEELQRKVL